MIHHITADQVFHHHSNVIQMNIYSPIMTAHKKTKKAEASFVHATSLRITPG